MNKFINIVMIIILIMSIFWTVYLKFPQFRVIKEVKKFTKKYPKHDTFKTFLVSLATNLGTGNLVGVTTGIIIGGPGVIVWMWIFGFFSSVLSYIENIYAIKYQEKIDGENRGGACYYILKGLNNPILSLSFAFFLLLTNTLFFPPIQVNTIIKSLIGVIPINRYAAGICLIIFIILIVTKGTNKIINITNRIVPTMTISFMLVILVLLFSKIDVLWDSIKLIFNSAFNFKSIGISVLLNTITVGIKRSLFSHEAGLGTMPSITGMSNAPTPTIQGYFGMLGVYVDTLLMCTITGIVIVQLNIDFNQFEGADLVIEIFKSNFGIFGCLMGSIFLFIFAFSSLLGQYYLGESNALLFTKFCKIKGKNIIFIYQIIFIIGLIIGIYFNMQIIIGLVDIGLLLLGGTNIIVLCLLEKKDKIAKTT